MKMAIFVLCLVLFFGAFLLMGYAFSAGAFAGVMFAGGIISFSLAIFIPFQLLGKSE